MRLSSVLGLALLASIHATSCRVFEGLKGKPPVTKFDHPQQVCLGRMRMTVPGPGAAVDYLSADIDGVYLKTEPSPPGQNLDQIWAGKRAELAKTRDFLKPAKVPAGRVGVEHREKTFPDSVSTLEIWQKYGTFLLQARVPISATATAAVRSAAEASIARVMDHYVAGDSVPASPSAFCVAGGWVDLVSRDGEGIKAYLHFPMQEADEHRLVLDIDMDVVTGNAEDTLLGRVDRHAVQDRLEDPFEHIMRHGQRTVAGMPGHEYVMTTTAGKYRTKDYLLEARFEFGGAADSLREPALSMSIAGVFFPDTLKSRDLLAFWDALLTSVHFQA